MQSKAVLTSTEIDLILAAARREAETNNWAVTIAIVDDGGHPLGLLRLDDCAPVSAYTATEKPAPLHSVGANPECTKK